MKKIDVEQQHLNNAKTQVLEAQEKAAKRKNVEEIRAILNANEPSPVVKRLTGLFTQEEVDKMAKEDPRIRYILTGKYE
jgi:hypothetical protein